MQINGTKWLAVESNNTTLTLKQVMIIRVDPQDGHKILRLAELTLKEIVT